MGEKILGKVDLGQISESLSQGRPNKANKAKTNKSWGTDSLEIDDAVRGALR